MPHRRRPKPVHNKSFCDLTIDKTWTTVTNPNNERFCQRCNIPRRQDVKSKPRRIRIISGGLPWHEELIRMGHILEVDCQRCGTVSQQLDGPTMLGFTPRCLECGTERFVSLTELYATDSADLEPASDEAWQLRERRIPEIAGTCDNCGGTFSVDAPIRCPGCRSRDVSIISLGFAC